MRLNFIKRRWLTIVLVALLGAVALVLAGRRLNATKIGGQGVAEPFRIAGNFYYVGATDAAAFLITGPEGHVVLDAGYPTTARLVMASIAELGFDIKDIKVLVNSEPHADHGGGLAALQEASGAELWASDASADVLGVLAASQYPEQAADREQSIRLLRSLPADIWVTCHARWWGRYRKFVASRTATNPVAPFIDPEGYRAYLDAAEADLRDGRTH